MKNRWVLQGLAIALALGGAGHTAHANGFGAGQSGAQDISLGSIDSAEQFGNIANLSRTEASQPCEPLLSGTGDSTGSGAIFAYGEVNPNNVIVDYNDPNRVPDSQQQEQPAPAPQRPEIDYSRIPQIVPVTETPTLDRGKYNPNIFPNIPTQLPPLGRRTPKKERPN